MTSAPPEPAGRSTVGREFQRLAQRLGKAGLDDAASVAEIALAHLLDVRPLDVHLRAREDWPEDKREALLDMTRRLVSHEPVQYVTGQAEFMGRIFLVDRRVLIPRPETEQLVLDALSDEAVKRASAPRFADVGTGSGVIAVSLALACPHAHIDAFDRSQDALELAQANALRLGAGRRIAWRCGDLLGDAPDDAYDAIVANLPYVETAELERLHPRVRQFEPTAALDGGSDGLRIIARLLPQARRTLKPGGLILLEIGERQGGAVRVALAHHGFQTIEIRPDLAGHDRIALAHTPRDV